MVGKRNSSFTALDLEIVRALGVEKRGRDLAARMRRELRFVRQVPSIVGASKL
jgi:hypothetical protein